ncbi:MAG: GxxExxY protein [Muribaculaceae bacterium]|nr:GxxExxY protein [Muribaculaceae bacterium]
MIIDFDGRYPFFHEITGVAMEVHRQFHGGLLESAYEAALAYLLPQKGYLVERQVYLPIYWNDVKLDQNYRMDLVINHEIIIELKAAKYHGNDDRRQLWNYMNITHLKYGMLINFAPEGLYSEWYLRNEDGTIDKVKYHQHD